MNKQPLGQDDATIQITVLNRPGIGTALFTCRAKDQDLTADELESIARDCSEVAALLRELAEADHG